MAEARIPTEASAAAAHTSLRLRCRAANRTVVRYKGKTRRTVATAKPEAWAVAWMTNTATMPPKTGRLWAQRGALSQGTPQIAMITRVPAAAAAKGVVDP